MNETYKIAYATSSRADYGIVRHYLEYLNNTVNIDLEIIVTGALLSEEYGHQVDLIYKDGFHNVTEVEVSLDSTCNAGVIHTMSQVLERFGRLFEKKTYDLLILLGDRYEMLSVATAAAMQKIPILHLHGGEATYANYDEFIRHCITKMSTYHFTATKEYRQRVIQLGEHPDRVFNLGALGAENCLEIDEKNVSDDIKALKKKSYFVVLFHPETLTSVDPLAQTNILLDAIDCFKEYSVVFIGSNADTHSDKIRTAVKAYVTHRDNAFYYENLHTDSYHYLIKNSICLVGNSSSGIIEVPSLGAYTVNIGDRQKGRIRGNSVIDIPCEKERIIEALRHISGLKCAQISNPYYKENTAQSYYKTTMELLSGIKETTSMTKVFFDITFFS